jgi:hypothetical protein
MDKILNGVKMILATALLFAGMYFMMWMLEAMFGAVGFDGCSPSNTSEC